MPSLNKNVFADKNGEMTLTPTGNILFRRGAVVGRETLGKIEALPEAIIPDVKVINGDASDEVPLHHDLLQNRVENKEEYAARIAKEKADAEAAKVATDAEAKAQTDAAKMAAKTDAVTVTATVETPPADPAKIAQMEAK